MIVERFLSDCWTIVKPFFRL